MTFPIVSVQIHKLKKELGKEIRLYMKMCLPKNFISGNNAPLNLNGQYGAQQLAVQPLGFFSEPRIQRHIHISGSLIADNSACQILLWSWINYFCYEKMGNQKFFILRLNRCVIQFSNEHKKKVGPEDIKQVWHEYPHPENFHVCQRSMRSLEDFYSCVVGHSEIILPSS
jgi:hypothetical protein